MLHVAARRGLAPVAARAAGASAIPPVLIGPLKAAASRTGTLIGRGPLGTATAYTRCLSTPRPQRAWDIPQIQNPVVRQLATGQKVSSVIFASLDRLVSRLRRYMRHR